MTVVGKAILFKYFAVFKHACTCSLEYRVIPYIAYFSAGVEKCSSVGPLLSVYTQ